MFPVKFLKSWVLVKLLGRRLSLWRSFQGPQGPGAAAPGAALLSSGPYLLCVWLTSCVHMSLLCGSPGRSPNLLLHGCCPEEHPQWAPFPVWAIHVLSLQLAFLLMMFINANWIIWGWVHIRCLRFTVVTASTNAQSPSTPGIMSRFSLMSNDFYHHLHCWSWAVKS